jgi:hypothetical protein
MIVMANLVAAWTGILLGFVAGAVQGLFFHREEWLGGYGSWPRRLTRLGHISFFGIAFINIAFAVTVSLAPPETPGAESAVHIASWLFILGAITMPLVCYLSAFKKPFRHLFCIPVASLVAAAGTFTIGVLFQ